MQLKWTKLSVILCLKIYNYGSCHKPVSDIGDPLTPVSDGGVRFSSEIFVCL
jgi:hypothetical protein